MHYLKINPTVAACIFGTEGLLSATLGAAFRLFLKDEKRTESRAQGEKAQDAWAQMFDRKDWDFSLGQSWEMNIWNEPDKKMMSLTGKGGPEEPLSWNSLFRPGGRGYLFVKAFMIAFHGDELNEAELHTKMKTQLYGLRDPRGLSVLFKGHAWNLKCASFNVDKD